MVEMIVFITGMAFAVALLFLIPFREVTQPPSRWHVLWEVLLPGTSPAWGYFGGLAMVGWTWWILFLVLATKTWGNAAVITDIATPNLVAIYAIPSFDPLALWLMFRPSWIFVYLMPAVLFAVNLLLVFRDKLFHKQL